MLKHHIHHSESWPSSSSYKSVIVRDTSGVSHRVRDVGSQGAYINGHHLPLEAFEKWKKKLEETGRSFLDELL